LAPFVDGEVTPGERAAVLRHVDECAQCRTLLEELRVVDGLLLRPRDVRLDANFTLETMAELRDLPAPAERPTPLAALIVCYVVASWLLLLAASILSPQPLRSAAQTVLGGGHTLVEASAGVWHVFARLAGWTFFIDLIIGLTLLEALRRARPVIVGRLRS
jgi:anti-sigma factor RsiW